MELRLVRIDSPLPDMTLILSFFCLVLMVLIVVACFQDLRDLRRKRKMDRLDEKLYRYPPENKGP